MPKDTVGRALYEGFENFHCFRIALLRLHAPCIRIELEWTTDLKRARRDGLRFLGLVQRLQDIRLRGEILETLLELDRLLRPRERFVEVDLLRQTILRGFVLRRPLPFIASAQLTANAWQHRLLIGNRDAEWHRQFFPL